VALDQAVSEAEAAREEIFLGLRLSPGVPSEQIAAFVVGSEDIRLWNDYEGWLAEGILVQTDTRVRFTERGYLVSNEVLSRFV
jgi:coproporphyrinogen III oxidase-like Fe-S oxidoreductase